MIPNDINRRILELYSGKRNRNIYPNPSSFGVNFAPTIHPHCGEKEVQDPICKGQIYYTFVWEPQREDTIFWQTQYYGTFAEGSTSDYPILNFLSLIDERYTVKLFAEIYASVQVNTLKKKIFFF